MIRRPMRILHTSDWHLGRTLGEWSLEADQRAMLAFVVDTLVRDPHDVLVVAGDVYDRSVPSELAVALFSEFLRDLRARAPRVPLVAVAGNHDSATRLATASDVLSNLEIHLRGSVDSIHVPIRIRSAKGDEADVFAIPFLWPGALNTHRDGQETRLGTQVSALSEAIARVEAAIDGSRTTIAVAHCLVLGGIASESERTIVGTATSVDAGLFDRFDYAALGHLHRSQKVGPRAHYSGSPIAYSFSEGSDTKVLLSVEVARGRAPKVRPIPIPGMRGVVELRGTLHELLSDPAHGRFVDHFVRAVLIDEVAPASPMRLLRTRFPFVLESPWEKPGSRERRVDVVATSVAVHGEGLREDFAAFEVRLGRTLDAEDPLAKVFAGLVESVDRATDADPER